MKDGTIKILSAIAVIVGLAGNVAASIFGQMRTDKKLDEKVKKAIADQSK